VLNKKRINAKRGKGVNVGTPPNKKLKFSSVAKDIDLNTYLLMSLSEAQKPESMPQEQE